MNKLLYLQTTCLRVGLLFNFEAEKFEMIRSYSAIQCNSVKIRGELLPESCIGYRSEVRKSLGKRAGGDILARRHIELYGEDQNGEIPPCGTARISVPQ